MKNRPCHILYGACCAYTSQFFCISYIPLTTLATPSSRERTELIGITFTLGAQATTHQIYTLITLTGGTIRIQYGSTQTISSKQ